jgi:hypothetical protein
MLEDSDEGTQKTHKDTDNFLSLYDEPVKHPP